MVNGRGLIIHALWSFESGGGCEMSNLKNVFVLKNVRLKGILWQGEKFSAKCKTQIKQRAASNVKSLNLNEMRWNKKHRTSAAKIKIYPNKKSEDRSFSSLLFEK